MNGVNHGGIIPASGLDAPLYSLTLSVSKQMQPVKAKLMTLDVLPVLKLAETREIPIVDQARFCEIKFDRRDICIERELVSPIFSYATTSVILTKVSLVKGRRNIKSSRHDGVGVTELNRFHIERKSPTAQMLGIGYAGLDTGAHMSMKQVNHAIHKSEQRYRLKVACLKAMAPDTGWIAIQALAVQAEPQTRRGYGWFPRKFLGESKTDIS
jgi:dTDP-glucose pyrophosphorylase